MAMTLAAATRSQRNGIGSREKRVLVFRSETSTGKIPSV
jgi:hypothetical protein